MTDRPIIFSAPMILALLAGRKTMTRRAQAASRWQKVKTGDRLWVRENLRLRRDGIWLRSADDSEITLPAHSLQSSAMVAWAHHKKQDYCPSIFMPRWASRLTLIVTATKIERLQEISDDDCKREGIQRRKIIVSGEEHDGYSTEFSEGANDSYRGAFEHLWVSLHGLGGWKQNPEVVALAFTVHKQNIDALAEAA